MRKCLINLGLIPNTSILNLITSSLARVQHKVVNRLYRICQMLAGKDIFIENDMGAILVVA